MIPGFTAMSARLALAAVLAAGVVAASATLAGGGHVVPAANGAVLAKPSDGVVDVDTVLGYQGTSAAGTGMVLSSSGIVLTNNHVIRGATSIKVTDAATGRRFAAKVLGYDLADDVALLSLNGTSGLRTVRTGNSGSLHVGQRVTAVGNAGGVGGTPSITTGTVTALGRSITVGDGLGGSERLVGMVMSSAPVEPGDSGGPLLNPAGRVVGMITAASQLGFRGESNGGFAVPINRALQIAAQIEAGRASSTVHVGPTAFLGILTQSTGDQASAGAFVAEVVSGSAAAKAGLARGDVITAFDGHAVSSAQSLTRLVLRVHPGQKVGLRWLDPFGGSHVGSARPQAGPPQ